MAKTNAFRIGSKVLCHGHMGYIITIQYGIRYDSDEKPGIRYGISRDKDARKPDYIAHADTVIAYYKIKESA